MTIDLSGIGNVSWCRQLATEYDPRYDPNFTMGTIVQPCTEGYFTGVVACDTTLALPYYFRDV